MDQQQLDNNGNSADNLEALYRYQTDAQFTAAYAASIIASILSLYGSLTIVYLVVKHKRWGELYHRLILGLSITDVIVTIDTILQPFLTPIALPPTYAHGNFQTCEVAGFFFGYFFASYMYSAELSVFFLLMVRYGKTERQLSRLMEPHGHIIPILIPTILGIVGIVLNNFNPSLLFGICIYAPYPANCIGNDDVECERGESSAINRKIMAFFLVFVTLVGIVSTWLVYWTVRQQTKRNNRYAFKGSENEIEKKRLRAVRTQAILYMVAYLIGIVSITYSSIMDMVYTGNMEDISEIQGNTAIYASVFLLWFLFPLVGFWNCLIYIRPRWIRWKDANPTKSWFWAYRQVLSGKPAPTTARTAHLASDRPKTTNNGPTESNTNTDNVNAEAKVQEAGTTEKKDQETREENPRTKNMMRSSALMSTRL